MRRPIGRDAGLAARMVFTVFLLGLVYAGLVGLLIASGLHGITLIAFISVLFLINVFASERMALGALGAREVSPAEAPQLHAIVERLCIAADLPKPRVAIAVTDMPNAFALGLTQKRATVCATTGIINLLTPAELEGVLAHELSHVAHRDVAIMTIASFFATIAAYVVQFGFLFGGSSDDEDSGPSWLVVVLVSLVVYVVSWFLMMALSRYREFAADRGAAVLTGRPSALASALLKISSGVSRIPSRDLRSVGELSAFYIVSPRSLSSLFSTHPPVEARVARLQALEAGG